MASDYGRGTLIEHWFLTAGSPSIQPGVFIIRTGKAFEYRPVPPGEWPYCAIALDQPELGGMVPSDIRAFPGAGAAEAASVGRMGHFARTDGPRNRIGHDRADRAWDTSAVLDRLLDRFHADPQHAQTGFIARSLDEVGMIWRPTTNSDTTELIRCVGVPQNANQVVTKVGLVYSSHHRRSVNPLPSPSAAMDWLGWAGQLTLVGQIMCLAAVLRDRLAELGSQPPAGVQPTAIRLVAGRLTNPLDWTITDRRDLEAVRGELGQWSVRALDANGPREGEASLVGLSKPGGWTKAELVAEAKERTKLSGTVFLRIAKQAKLKPSERGGRGQQRKYSKAELRKLMAAVKSGPFRYKDDIAAAWRELLGE